MRTYRIDFAGETFHAIGRNGIMKCKGVAINAYERHLTVMPITSKGVAGNCLIDIPREDVEQFISILRLEVMPDEKS
jgi:hypothetical protein